MSYTTNDPDFPPCFTVEKSVPLAHYTNIRIGGPAQYLTVVSDQTLFVEIYRFCRQISLPFLAIGQGTNILFSDKGRAGMTAVINFDKLVTVAKNAVVAEAGATLEQVMDLCIENGLTGFEFASGIPGTVGGAVYGNAGAYGNSIGELITRARILTPEGKIECVEKDFFKFSYRRSFIKEYTAMVLQAELQLERGEAAEIASRCREIIETRRQKLPPAETLTAGSWFKNIKDAEGRATAAAVYLEAVGAKETSVGDAAVHPKHANIFYNKGRATAADMLKLQEILQQRVFDQFGIRLQREVMHIE